MCGQLFQDGTNEIKLPGEVLPVHAGIKVFDGFSAHDDQTKMQRWFGTSKSTVDNLDGLAAITRRTL
jgi:hypothetical protein